MTRARDGTITVQAWLDYRDPAAHRTALEDSRGGRGEHRDNR